MNSAETAYLFRHALLRDAAYQLQLPGDRARLHRFALELIEAFSGGRPPELPALVAGEKNRAAQSTDPVARELAEHAFRAARELETGEGALFRAGRMYLRRAAEYAEAQFQGAVSEQLWLELAGMIEGEAKGEALRRAGDVARICGWTARAEGHFTSALESHRGAGCLRGEGTVLASLANLHVAKGRFDLAEKCHESALVRFRDSGDRGWEGTVLGNLAGVYRVTGRREQAEGAYRRARALIGELGPDLQGSMLCGLANLYMETNRLEEADRIFDQAIELLRLAADLRAEGITVGNRAILDFLAGRLGPAEKSGKEALAIHREVGNRRSEGIALGNLALVYDNTRRPEPARESYLQALAIIREVGDRATEGVTLGNLGGFCTRAGRLVEAREAFAEALSIHREIGNRYQLGFHLCDEAVLFVALKQPERAQESWKAGASLLLEMGEARQLEDKLQKMAAACSRAGIAPFDAPSP